MKVIQLQDENKLQACENEFDILSKLEHPGIVRALNMFVDRSSHKCYTVFELVEGGIPLDECQQ